VLRRLALVLVGACTPVPSTYSCSASAMCVDEQQGTCEPTGFCSFPDATCTSGKRYGSLSGALADQCVDGPAPKRELSFDTAADLTNFPVPLVLDATRVDYAQAGASGESLRILDDNDMALPIEIELWDATATSIVWVGIPHLASSVHVYLTYGSDPLPAPAMVWDASYAAVWHLGSPPLAGAPGAIHDSTANAADGTARPTTAAPVAGQLGHALTFDGNLDYIAMPDQPALQVSDTTSFTLEAWVRPTQFSPSSSNLFRYDDCDDSDGDMVCTAHALYALRLEADGHPNVFYGPSTGLSTCGNPTPFTAGAWRHLAFVRDAVAHTNVLYVDGQMVSTRADTATGTWTTTGQFLMLGRFHTSGSDEALQGDLDEARVSTVARSATWMQAQFAAMTDQLVVFGPPP